MLSRLDNPLALDIELANAIYSLSPEHDTVSGLTTEALLEKLIRLTPGTDDNLLSMGTTLASRVECLRARLRMFLADEDTANFPLALYDSAFKLQITLARGFPINQIDTISQEPISPADRVVFFSNGNMLTLESANLFYEKKLSYNDAGEYKHPVHLQPLKRRDVLALCTQGVTFIRAPSAAERIMGKIGKYLGFFLSLNCYFMLAFLMPLNLCLIPLIIGGATAVLACITRTTLSPLQAFVAGIVASVILLSLAAFIFPPLAGLLALSGLITAGTAAAACVFYANIVMPVILPWVIAVGFLLARLITRISIPELMERVITGPRIILETTFEWVGKKIGKCVNALGCFLGIVKSQELPQPPLAEIQQAAEAAPVVNERRDSTAAVLMQMRFDGFEADAAPLQLQFEPDALQARVQPQADFVAFSGQSMRLGDVEVLAASPRMRA